MTELVTLARPYAKAAFDHASESKALAPWSDGLSVAAQITQDTDFAAFLTRPDLTQSQKSDALLKVMAMDNKDISNFITLLGQNSRLTLLPAISDEFELFKAQGLKEIDVVVETAYELTKDQIGVLSGKLATRFAATVNMTTVVNSDLIAGVIIRAGDQVIDDSVVGKLSKLRAQLI